MEHIDKLPTNEVRKSMDDKGFAFPTKPTDAE